VTVANNTMARIGRGMELSQRGDRAAARCLFAEIWDDIGGEAGDAFHRCALAHSMADVQDEAHEELMWDLRALAAADAITDDRAADAGVAAPVAAFYPSLHLNLGECFRKVGDLERAREHLRRGQRALPSLADDGYGRLVRSGLDRLAKRLAERARSV